MSEFPPTPEQQTILDAVKTTKQNIMIRALINKILTISIGQAYNGVIDFTDQVYMPALFGGTYPSFPVVLVDEYQDLSPVKPNLNSPNL